jgi:hypothetical protein
MSVQHLYDNRSEITRSSVSMVPQTTIHMLTQYMVGDEFIRYDVA